MTNSQKIHFKIGVPEHGWLPLQFKHGDFELILDLSDVPLDPMAQLCDSLIQLLKGINTPDRILWHLEPYCYYLKLEKTKDGYDAIILESNGYNSPVKITKKISGTFESIISPLYRALKKFDSYSYQPPNWEPLNSKRIIELTKLIKKIKELKTDGLN